MNYERIPGRIYEQSFARIRAETDLSRFPEDGARVAERVVHACGMVDVADELQFTPGFAATGRAALKSGVPIFCDGQMTASGLMQRLLSEGSRIVAPENRSELSLIARERGTTLSAVAVECWAAELAGAIVAIGNAPTALFRLLELLDEGADKPAVIFAFPVGFVGAAESKRELMRDSRGVDYLTLPGRRGGSAMAAAAVNALLLEAAA
ncbi:MAG: precorrin-8X methylmutase [Rhodobacteraceae bacterium]|nr:precorrin-8X methylmutase [Paracoccaceae bacterium]